MRTAQAKVSRLTKPQLWFDSFWPPCARPNGNVAPATTGRLSLPLNNGAKSPPPCLSISPYRYGMLTQSAITRLPRGVFAGSLGRCTSPRVLVARSFIRAMRSDWLNTRLLTFTPLRHTNSDRYKCSYDPISSVQYWRTGSKQQSPKLRN
jgi:hypothetical protein